MPRTLLLADDSVTIQRVIELTFAEEDIRVVAVSDGDEAIVALGNNPPDIVLADVGMPGRDGYQVAEHIKRTPALSHIPVLLLTGAFEPVDQARAAEAGCDGVLAKPFEPQLVIGRVKELLAKPKSSPAAPDAPSPPSAAATPWAPAFDESAGKAPIGPTAAPEEVDRYFDRLDRAFANLASGHVDDESRPMPAPPPAEIDWFSTTAPSQPAATQAAVDRLDGPDPKAEEAAAVAPPARSVEGFLPPSASLPPLADAFAALLAAEQAVPVPPAAPWPTVGESAPPAAPQEINLSDDVIEDIVKRVLERMSDRLVRETVANIASETAERLVKEEIERIRKAAE